MNFAKFFITQSQTVTVELDTITPVTFIIKRVLLEAKDGASVENPLPTFSWNPYPKATSYTINVYDPQQPADLYHCQAACPVAAY